MKGLVFVGFACAIVGVSWAQGSNDDDYYSFDDDEASKHNVHTAMDIVNECFVDEDDDDRMFAVKSQADLCATAGDDCFEQTILFKRFTPHNETLVHTPFDADWWFWPGRTQYAKMEAVNEATGTYIDWHYLNETGYRTICAKPDFVERYTQNGTFGNPPPLPRTASPAPWPSSCTYA
jgi:hypothetical protein